MKILKDNLGDALNEAVTQINTGLRTLQDKGLVVLMPEFVDVNVDMIYTANHISRVQTSAQDAYTDTGEAIDAAAVDTDLNAPFTDTEIGGAGTETTQEGEREEVTIADVGETVETREIGERTSTDYRTPQVQETEAINDYSASRERNTYVDDLGNVINYF
jgi:hypothetical protein